MRGCGKPDPAMVRCTNANLKTLLMRAYNVKGYQIQGPAWIESDGYDVMAKVPDGVPADKVPAMLQALLAERFGVKIHKETRVLPAYELSVAKGGPKLKEVETAKLQALPEPGSALPPPPRAPGNGPPPLSSMPVGALMFMIHINGSRMVRGNITIEALVNHLTSTLNRPVFDKTDLKGTTRLNCPIWETKPMADRLPRTFCLSLRMREPGDEAMRRDSPTPTPPPRRSFRPCKPSG
jgi:uncharacterized protein (TIGR03435 family)